MTSCVYDDMQVLAVQRIRAYDEAAERCDAANARSIAEEYRMRRDAVAEYLQDLHRRATEAMNART